LQFVEIITVIIIGMEEFGLLKVDAVSMRKEQVPQ